MKQTKKLLVLFLLGVIFLSCTQTKAPQSSFDESALSEKGKAAYQILLKVDLFALGGVGEGGETSDGEKSLDVLLEEKESVNAFRSLVKNTTPEGGLYALFGLRMLKCECFKEEIEVYKKLPEPPERKLDEYFTIPAEEVGRMSGCKIFWQKRVEVVEEIVNGKFDKHIERKEELKKQKSKVNKIQGNKRENK